MDYHDLQTDPQVQMYDHSFIHSWSADRPSGTNGWSFIHSWSAETEPQVQMDYCDLQTDFQVQMDDHDLQGQTLKYKIKLKLW